MAYFNPTKSTTVHVDTFSRGYEATLIQDGKPVAFVSKTLTSAEQRCAHIEWEMLLIVFGWQKFYTYLYGKPFTVEIDHKHLEMPSQKKLSAAPPRLQWMLRDTGIQPHYHILYWEDAHSRWFVKVLKHKDNFNSVNLNIRVQFVQVITEKLEELK